MTWERAALVCGALLSGFSDAAAQTPALQLLTNQEFIGLTEDYQVLFVAGVLEGIAFTNYSRPDYKEWAECVRMAPLETLLEQVNASIALGATEPIAWLVVRAIGARECPK